MHTLVNARFEQLVAVTTSLPVCLLLSQTLCLVPAAYVFPCVVAHDEPVDQSMLNDSRHDPHNAWFKAALPLADKKAFQRYAASAGFTTASKPSLGKIASFSAVVFSCMCRHARAYSVVDTLARQEVSQDCNFGATEVRSVG